MVIATLLTTSISLLLVLHVIVCLLLAVVVLMQRPKNEGLGAAFGSGMTDSVWGAQTTDILQKGTKVFGVLFFVITLTLAILMGRQNIGLEVISLEDQNSTPELPVDGPTVPELPEDTVSAADRDAINAVENKVKDEEPSKAPEKKEEAVAPTPTPAPGPVDPGNGQ